MNAPFDPRSLDLDQRRQLCQQLHQQNRAWLERLGQLAEPRPDRDFPGFLLATPAFAELSRRIGAAQRRGDLSTAVADELDHFVEAYRYYLRTCSGEDVFASQGRRTSDAQPAR